MNYRGAILKDIRALLSLFKSKCQDDKCLFQLSELLEDHERWHEAHALFYVIRAKTLVALKKKNTQAIRLYLFEEICAKTMYNLSRGAAPFDPDSPYWVLPNALALGRCLGVPDAQIINCVTLDSE